MANNLTDVAENRLLDWLNGNAATAPVLPLKARLMTANGDDATPGTEVVNGGGSAYAAQTVAFPAAAAGAAANSALITFTNMPAIGGGGVVGIEIWDSAGAPVRWWWGPLAAAKVTNLGDDFEFQIGTISQLVN
jgi:hypothetical protein